MAYRQPIQQQPTRIANTARQAQHSTAPAYRSLQTEKPSEEGWLLFPQPTSASSPSHFAHTQDFHAPAQSVHTEPISLCSDDGFQTGGHDDAPSLSFDFDNASAVVRERERDLDSLDADLYAFRGRMQHEHGEDSHLQRTVSVLPMHDGFGAFGMSAPAVQERLFQFERFNGKRRRLNVEAITSSNVLEGLREVEHPRGEQDAKLRRIEAWMTEQESLVMDEIRKATRQRSERTGGTESVSIDDAYMLDDGAGGEAEGKGNAEVESFVSRLARTLLDKLLGLDTETLEIIMGERLADEAVKQSGDGAGQPPVAGRRTQEPWEARLVTRVARELGVLLQHFTTHPGAFSIYHSDKEPVSPSMEPRMPNATATSSIDDSHASHHTYSHIPTFQPTLRTKETTTAISLPSPPNDKHMLTRDDWERKLDIMLVYRYFRSRFSSAMQPSEPVTFAPSRSFGDAAKSHPLMQVNNHIATENRSTQSTSLSSERPRPRTRPKTSSCGSEHKHGATMAGKKSWSVSSRSYWDMGGGSAYSGSVGGEAVWTEV